MRNCKKCDQPAATFLRVYRLHLCADHFLEFLRNRVSKTIKKYQMINPHERIAVALSGGKDSAVLLHVLDHLYAETLELIGIHVDLGIESQNYSRGSLDLAKESCRQLDREFHCITLEKEFQITMDRVKAEEKRLRRPPCAACGTIKRYVLNRYSLKLDCERLATGHVLDDEASVLLLNLFNGNVDQLIRTGPNLSGVNNSMITRIKPLYETYEFETALYTQFAGLKFQNEECPYSVGASTFKFKKFLLNFEEQHPGIEQSFLQNFNKRILPSLKMYYEKPEDGLITACSKCNGPTTQEICAFCNLRSLLIGEK